MTEKIIRKLDSLGRMVLPREFTTALGWEEGRGIAVTRKGDALLLEADREVCCLCGSEEDILPVKVRFVCAACLTALRERN